MGRYVVRMQIKVIYNGVISVQLTIGTSRRHGTTGGEEEMLSIVRPKIAGPREYPVFIRSLCRVSAGAEIPGTCRIDRGASFDLRIETRKHRRRHRVDEFAVHYPP